FYSDLGGSFSSNLVAEWGDWALSVVNGEGRDTEVPEQHKEAALYFHLTPWTPFSVSLGYLRGAYDKYDNDVNLRERIQVLLTYRTEDDHWKFGLEFLDAHDPADAITDLKMADGVDVTSLTGQVVHGRGGSLYTIVRTGPKAELMLRWDTLNPVVGESGKNLNTYLGALAYQVTEDVKAAFEADYTQYGSQFGNGIRDSSKIEIAAQVLF
ncbi:MAG TPA: hypothetical protein VN132_00065, partial [Bdellovibrio sp.]|nr:hypothetical protein [Bdellovibrio sp.]